MNKLLTDTDRQIDRALIGSVYLMTLLVAPER